MESVLTIIVISILAFLLLREAWCWYFKINTIVYQNSEIIRLLKKLAGERDED